MSQWEKGQSGNPNGRPKGTGNKVSQEVKGMIEEILIDPDNVAKLKKELTALSGRDYIKAFTELFPYIVPKLSNTSLDVDIEKMSDEDLEALYQRIIAAAK